MKITVIIPTYNEANNVKKAIQVVETAIGKIRNHTLNILVTDDSSPDGTGEIVKSLFKKYPNLSLISSPKKVGIGGGYLVAMEKAFEKDKVDAVFEFDCDLSHDASKIPLMVEKLDQGFDMVIGSRYIPGGGIPDNWGIQRKFMSIFGNIVAMCGFMNFTVRDWTGGFRVFRRWVYEAIKPNVKEIRGYTFQISTLYWALRNHAKITEVPFHFVDRTADKSKLPKLEYILSTLMFIIRVRLSEPTIKKFVKFGIVGFTGYIVSAFSLWVLGKSQLEEWLIWLTSTELSIVSNFIWNNLWTFRAEMFTSASDLIHKFAQFNMTSAGAIVILTVMGTLLTTLFGSEYRQLFLPFIILFLVLPYNWLMYTRVVWKEK